MATGSFSTIKIHRAIPIIAGYLQLEPNREKDKQRVAFDGVAASPPVVTLGPSAGASTAGSRYGTQQLYELPGVGVSEIDSLYNTIKSAVA